PGTYQVTAIGEGGACVIPSAAVMVLPDGASAPPTPSITANSPLCVGGTLTLQTETVAGAIYTWGGPNGFTSASEDPSISSVTDDHAGVYSLQIRVGQCKSDVVTKRIDVARLADFAITSNNPTNTVCDGSSVSLSVNSAANHTFQWRKDGANIATETNPTLSANGQGVYTVLVKNMSLNCEVETSSVTLTVLDPPVAAYTSDLSICAGESVAFTNESQADSRATVLHAWDFDDGFHSSEQSPTHAYTTAQTFNASLTVSYQGVSGCSDNETKGIAVVAATQPSITASEISACPDEEVTLSVAGSFTSILWSNSETDNAISALPGTHSVTTVDANGCPGAAQVVIAAKEVPVLVASADPAIISLGGTSQLTASGADTYLWVPGETLDNPAIASPKASPLGTTTYRVMGSSADGCKDSVDVLVAVSGTAEFPAAFSPNGDGLYDIWNVRAESNPDCILTIFDGRGRRIFEKGGENWDGTYQGTAVPDGTYYYVYGCPDQKPQTGSVLVFK
ncbi:MAG TPA: gliding motility-associated C-terminal domain-containing protein, partial [Chryseosolibacter sp.]